MDGWAINANEKSGVVVARPQSFAERQLVAGHCAAKLKPRIPVFVDEIADTAGNLWSAMPARLYVIESQGKVAWKSGRGPFGI